MTDKKTQDNGAAPQPEETGANEHGTTGEAEAERSLEDLQTEVETLRDHLLRAKAEVQNILKRSEREKSEIAQYAIAGFARDLLSVADNLRRALEAVPADAADNPALKALVEGEYDHLPESAFYMVGSIDQAVEKAQKMAEES